MLYIRIRYISTAKLRGNEFLKCILRTTRRKFLNINGRFVARICLSIAWKCICFHITWSRQILLGSHISDSKATATIDTKCTIFMVASKLDHPHTVYLHVVWARDYSFGTSIGHNTTFPTSIAVVVTTNMLIALHPADPVFGNTRVNSMVIVYEYRCLLPYQLCCPNPIGVGRNASQIIRSLRNGKSTITHMSKSQICIQHLTPIDKSVT